MSIVQDFALQNAAPTPVSYTFKGLARKDGLIQYRSTNIETQLNLAPLIDLAVTQSNAQATRHLVAVHLKIPIPVLVEGVRVPSGRFNTAHIKVSVQDDQPLAVVNDILTFLRDLCTGSVSPLTVTLRNRDTML